MFMNFSTLGEDVIESQAGLTNEAWFSRCYSHITGTRAPVDHPLLLNVRAGNIEPVAACMSVFDKAMILQSTNRIDQTNDVEALSVLSVFFDFHKSWFQFNDFENAPVVYQGNIEFHHDAAHESCYLTHALFSGNGVASDERYQNSYDFKKVVTTNSDVRCIRSEPTRVGVNRYDATDYNTLPAWAEAPGRGFLIGTTERPAYDNTWYTLTGRPITTVSYTGGGQVENIDTFVPHTHGGGLLGSTGLLIKYGQYANDSDGGAFLRRRLTSNVMEHMLCRTAPYRRIEDVTSDVVQFNTTYPTNFTLPFRRDTACMSCHSTQDGLAGVYRNINYRGQQGYVDWNDNGIFGRPAGELNFNRNADPEDSTFLVRAFAIKDPAETVASHMQLTDAKYKTRPPNGLFIYRSYDGAEIKHPIKVTGTGRHPAGEGIQQVGEFMAEDNDLYVCAAKRYFEFFTGIDANLQDPGDSRNTPLLAADQVYKDQVVKLGLSLKTHQSLRKLVYEIISSDIYKNESIRDLQ